MNMRIQSPAAAPPAEPVLEAASADDPAAETVPEAAHPIGLEGKVLELENKIKMLEEIARPLTENCSYLMDLEARMLHRLEDHDGRIHQATEQGTDIGITVATNQTKVWDKINDALESNVHVQDCSGWNKKIDANGHGYQFDPESVKYYLEHMNKGM